MNNKSGGGIGCGTMIVIAQVIVTEAAKVAA